MWYKFSFSSRKHVGINFEKSNSYPKRHSIAYFIRLRLIKHQIFTIYVCTTNISVNRIVCFFKCVEGVVEGEDEE